MYGPVIAELQPIRRHVSLLRDLDQLQQVDVP
jgi:hypothetical protein